MSQFSKNISWITQLNVNQGCQGVSVNHFDVIF